MKLWPKNCAYVQEKCGKRMAYSSTGYVVLVHWAAIVQGYGTVASDCSDDEQVDALFFLSIITQSTV